MLADTVAHLEGAALGATGASGMSVLAAGILSRCRPGDCVLAASNLYGVTLQLLRQMEVLLGLKIYYFDPMQRDSLIESIGHDPNCIVEGISNPFLEVADLPWIVQKLGAVPLLVDNPFATPILQNPCEFGAAAVVHAASKYLNGHGDVLAGVIVCTTKLILGVKHIINLLGMNCSPFESWLASRGLRTLPLRMQRICETAMFLATALQDTPGIAKIYYPGLDRHTSALIARRMLRGGFGGIISFELNDGEAAANQLIRRLSLKIPFTPTLGDIRTTISHPASTSHRFMTQQERDTARIGGGLVPLSVGLEEPQALLKEVIDALK